MDSDSKALMEQMALDVLRGKYQEGRALADLLVDLVATEAKVISKTFAVVDVKNVRAIVYWKDSIQPDAGESERTRQHVREWINGTRETLVMSYVDRVEVYELGKAKDADEARRHATLVRELDLQSRDVDLIAKKKALVNYVRQPGELLQDYQTRIQLERADALLTVEIEFSPPKPDELAELKRQMEVYQQDVTRSLQFMGHNPLPGK